MTAKTAKVEGGGNSTLFYPTLTAFMDNVNALEEESPGAVQIGSWEAMTLLLMCRWQLEDEGNKPEELASVNADLAMLNRDVTDSERGRVMMHLMAWARNGDGWLGTYLERIAMGHKGL